MGNGVDFFARDERGRRSEYVSLASPVIVNGVKGHLIKKKGDKDTHTNLPLYSNTSDVYLRQNSNGVCQARVYSGQKTFLDFDWSHNHTNPDGTKFPRGVVHVQVWQLNADGRPERVGDSARFMNNTEMKMYGPLLKKYYPNVKFRK
jgi:hypothetical protein